MAPEIRTDKGYAARGLTVLGLCLAAAAALALWAWHDGTPTPRWGLVLVIALVLGWISIVRVIIWPCFIAYRCPLCREKMPRARAVVAGVSARYHCARCNITWDLFFRGGDGSG
jgi:membrane protein YdbS with pleckstrin-like domain